jgi:hypothetical protein
MQPVAGGNNSPQNQSIHSAYTLGGIGIALLLFGLFLLVSSSWQEIGALGRSSLLALPVVALSAMAWYWRKQSTLQAFAQVSELLALVLAPIFLALVFLETKTPVFVYDGALTVSGMLTVLSLGLIVSLFLSDRRTTANDAITAFFAAGVTVCALVPYSTEFSWIETLISWLIPVAVLLLLALRVLRAQANAQRLGAYAVIAVPAVLFLLFTRFMGNTLMGMEGDMLAPQFLIVAMYAAFAGVLALTLWLYRGYKDVLTEGGHRVAQFFVYCAFFASTIAVFGYSIVLNEGMSVHSIVAVPALLFGAAIALLHSKNASGFVQIVAYMQIAGSFFAIFSTANIFMFIVMIMLAGIAALAIGARRILRETAVQGLEMPPALDFLRINTRAQDSVPEEPLYSGFTLATMNTILALSVPTVIALIGYITAYGLYY